jgi:diguanylate cyclase (GGDEF)-like protein
MPEVAGTFVADVLEMLDFRESRAVPAWLGRRLQQAFPGARHRELHVYPAGAARIKGLPAFEVFSVGDDATGDTPLPLSGDVALVETIASRRQFGVAADAGGSRLLVLLEYGGEPRYVVEIAGDVGATHDDRRLRALVAVAARYYERLVESETDPLTRLGNRRIFHAQLDAGIRHWASSTRVYAFAFIDIDHFKRINDAFGHLYGDEILVHLSNLFRRTFRAGDQLYRYGGEEFAVVFAVSAPDDEMALLERLRAAVAAYEFPGGRRVTVSVGAARIRDAATPSATIVERADRALYYAKEHGRDRVCAYEALVASGEMRPKTAAAADVTLF